MARVIGNAPASAPQPQRQDQQPARGAAQQGQQPPIAGIDSVTKTINWFKAQRTAFAAIGLVIALVLLYSLIRDPALMWDLEWWRGAILPLFVAACLIRAYVGGVPKWLSVTTLTLLIVAIILVFFGIAPKQIGKNTGDAVQIIKGVAVKPAAAAISKPDPAKWREAVLSPESEEIEVNKGDWVHYKAQGMFWTIRPDGSKKYHDPQAGQERKFQILATGSTFIGADTPTVVQIAIRQY